jgi:hypothetical protein
MTRVRALDSDHDWQFGKGQNDYKRNNAAVIQNIDTGLNQFLGDCFFDTKAGLDWFNMLGGKNQLALNLAISAQILNTKDVTGIRQLSVDLSADRRLSVSYVVETNFSTTRGLFDLNLTEV